VLPRRIGRLSSAHPPLRPARPSFCDSLTTASLDPARADWEGDISTPFGGFRGSGFGGRDNGLEAFDQYTELKTIWVTLQS
jgi:hypothetical protein